MSKKQGRKSVKDVLWDSLLQIYRGKKKKHKRYDPDQAAAGTSTHSDQEQDPDQAEERTSTHSDQEQDAFGPVADFIDVIRQLYKDREGWLSPFPWCEEFGFHLDNIFTRLKMVSRKKERGVKTDSIVNMLEIFKPHEEYSQPKRVLIEGQPGMGKTTYCNKVAYDWAKNCKAEDSFPDFQVLLLLKCRDITSDLWEAIDDQLLPKDIKKEETEKFFTFVRDHQSKVLLVLDGLDELPSDYLPLYKEIIEGRMLPNCYLVVTARHEAGIKVRKCCHTLLEVEGFTEDAAEGFIRRYFKTDEHLAKRLLDKLGTDASLSGLTANPLNTALLCLLCEDFQGDLPKGKTLLYHEIVQCVLRRYRKKKELPNTDEDLTQLYHAELKHLGSIAWNGLLNDEMYFDDSAFRTGTRNLIPELGFLSAQAGRSKRRQSCCYGFLHKSFQEFFAALYLSCQLVDEEINPDGLLADTRYFKKFQQVLMFTCGIMAQRCKAKAMALMASIAGQINQSNEEESDDYLWTALNCIKESGKEQGTFGKELACFLGSLLEIQRISCLHKISDSGAAILSHAMATNSTVKELDLSFNGIGHSGAAALAKAVEINSTLTQLNLFANGIGDSGAATLAKAVEINSTLTELDLSYNGIGDSGAAALAKAVEINSTLTTLVLLKTGIGDSGAAALAKAVEISSTLTKLDLSYNEIGDPGAAAVAKAVEISSTLTELDLSYNGIGDSGAAALAKAVEINSTLTQLNLFGNEIGDSGAAALAKAVKVNSTLTELDLSYNGIGDSGAAALAKAAEINSTLTTLVLLKTGIGDSGAAALAKAVEISSTLTKLDLSYNEIGDSGAAAVAKAVEISSLLTELDLSYNGIGDSGAAALAKAVEINSTLTQLNLFANGIGDSGAAALAKAVEINSTLTELDLSYNGIGDTGAAALAKAVEINSTLTTLVLLKTGIGDSGAAALAKAVEISSTLTKLDLSYNKIGDSGAAALARAVEINSTLTQLNLFANGIGDSGAAALAKAAEINSTLTQLNLSDDKIGDLGAAALAKVK
ncbi:NLR family CARD domain-containing protein 3-like isoform X3 [Montipora foliosa]|uniref:NLR family CARD domain-containing protein 3-like isoform X3 n=1 Tax=Montipora foliosa TaxID=591990 RepID=UPI0035F1AA59